MKRARNSDAKTLRGKSNQTPRTELGKKSLWYIFFDPPCTTLIYDQYKLRYKSDSRINKYRKYNPDKIVQIQGAGD